MKAPKKLFCKSQAKRECSIWRICVKSGRSRVGGRISSCFDYANRTRSIHLSSANPSQFVFCCCHVDNIRSRCALVLRVNLSYPRVFFFSVALLCYFASRHFSPLSFNIEVDVRRILLYRFWGII